MAEYRRDDPAINDAARQWGEITAELNALEGKSDSASHERYLELIEQLMCADMALGPVRRAMGSAAGEKLSQQPPDTNAPKPDGENSK